MRTPLLLLKILFLPLMLAGQTFHGDSILANERSIDRPLTLHARQLRATGGYGLSIISRKYDNTGEAISLKNEGLSSIRHRFFLDLKYGLHDVIQLSAAIAQSSNVVREQTRYIYPLEPDPVVSQNVMREYAGLEDLYLGLDLRAPLKTKRFDLAITLGINLPVAAFEPSTPEHSFKSNQENGTTFQEFVYHYNYPVGKGVSVARMGGMAKYRAAKWALSARLDYQHGLKDGSSFEWRHQLNEEGTFEYRQDAFTYRLPDSYTYFVEAEYQPLPWFDLFLNVSGYTAFDGWTSSQEDLKIAIPYQISLMASPGFEIIVTPRLWLRERINFSLAGQSYEAPFGFETSVLYNFFPFK